jgi:hypothetical protein
LDLLSITQAERNIVLANVQQEIGLYIPRNLLKSDFYKMGPTMKKLKGLFSATVDLAGTITRPRRVINYQPVKNTIWQDVQFYCEKNHLGSRDQ